MTVRRCFLVLLALVLLLFCVSCGGEELDDPALEMRFLDVGQGDATLLRTSAGDILVDAGSDASEEGLCLRLAQLGVVSLELAIFTHSDEDHIGGADGVLRAFPTRTVWLNPFFGENECVTRLMDAATETGAQVERVQSGVSRTIGRTVMTVFSPYGSMEGANENDRSTVLKLVCGEVSTLLMGDVGEYTEELLFKAYDPTQFSCDLLKVGHHGSSGSTGAAFISAARPRYAVISCEKGNAYGHPHGEVLARLETVGTEILRTDLSGEVVFCTDGVQLEYIRSDSEM